MSKLHLGALAISLSAVLASACSSNHPATEHIGQTSQDIQGGASDGTKHPFAVGVCGGPAGNICQLTCSGVLITPNLVLSARHCVDQTPEMIDCTTTSFGALYASASNYFITTSSTMPGNSTVNKHVVKQIITPTPTAVCGNDLSLLILEDLVPDTEATPAIPGTGYSLTDHTQYNFESYGFTAIGYGITSPNGQDSGTRRILSNIQVTCIPGDSALDCAAGGAPRNVYDDKEFIGGDGTCQGDSGSAAYAEQYFDTGKFVAMGVLSRGGQSQDGTMCQESIYTRLDSWHDLIVQTATTASNNWSLYPKPTPDWTVYVAPPTAPAGTGGTDGGKSGGSSGTKTFGDACTTDTQCVSKNCISGDGGKTYFCTQACTVSDATSCPATYGCDPSSLLCTPGAAAGDGGPSAPNETTTVTKSGCSIAPVAADPSKPVPWKALGVSSVLALILGARRRRRPPVQSAKHDQH
jgi:hypothetical protein